MVFFFIGILLTQLLYVISNWRQYRSNDYVRYALYIVLFIIYIFCIFPNEVITDQELLDKVNPVVDIVKRPLAFLIYLIYFRFMALFLGLREKYPSLHKQVIVSYWAIGLFFFLQIALLIAGQAYTSFGNNLYFGVSFFLFVLSVIFIIKSYRHKNILTVTLLRGSVCLVSGAFITNIYGIYSIFTGRQQQITDYIPMFAGILLELFFFNLALSYKVVQEQNQLTRTQQLVIEQLTQNGVLDIEQRQIRNKIARDLHDEVGATLSGVTLFGELALRKISRNQFHDIDTYLRRISNECGHMSEKLVDIVWTTNMENVTLERLFDHLMDYAKPVCSSKRIELRSSMDQAIKGASFPTEVRNHLYLFCKEAINNAVKYSGGSTIDFSVKLLEHHQIITIADNGNGFDADISYEGNGLKNMKSRAAEMGAEYEIRSAKDKGTSVQLILKMK